MLDNTGVTGQYTSSEGLKGDKVWGTRGRWCILDRQDRQRGRSRSRMLDHPSNPNAPTYWHARGYGLFAANPLGRKVFEADQEELVLTLEPGKSVTYRHRILILERHGDGRRDRARVPGVRAATSSTPSSR